VHLDDQGAVGKVIADLKVSPPNSLLLVGDPTGDPPTSMGGKLVAHSQTCVAVGTVAELDGESHVRVAASSAADEERGLPEFDGVINLPTGTITVSSVSGEVYARSVRTSHSARVRIWVDHPSEPIEIFISIL
jgi:hypothetical protein